MEEKLIQRLESAVARLEALSTGFRPAGASPESGADAAAASDPSILAFDDLMVQFMGRVSGAAEKIGGKVLEVTKVLEEAFSAQKELLIKVKQTRKPDMAGLAEFLKPLNEVIMKANTLTEGRRSDFFNHLKSAADSLSALAWIAYTGKDCGMSLPIAHVEESWQMAEFYNNKILVEYKNKDPNHVEWAKALKELYLPGLRDYVKSFYPLGPVWSATGKTTVSAPSKAPAPRAPAPPPPTASLFSAESSQTSSSRNKIGMSAVFQEISSKPVTAGLRKVTDDMKTKNRADRTGIVGAGEKEGRISSPSFSKAGPPKLELQMGRKWVVENQIGKKNLVIDDCDAKQSVYIFGCKDSVLQIQGKVNNITIDKCTKMGIVFGDVVAACEIVNCNSIEVQCQGSAPTISVDNTSGCQLYLSKDSLEASLTTAKSSEINVLVPGAEADGDWGEHALPEQFVHVYKDGQFVTTPVSHSGGIIMSTSQSRGRRGNSFSIEEDEALCHAWLAISQDPAIGVGKKDICFWNRIFDHFSRAIIGKDLRTLCSIQNRWEKIISSCSKYRGCLSQIEHMHLTGTTQSDKVSQAKIMFAKENDDKPFLLDHCWKILQDSQKWLMLETPADPVPISPGTSDYPSTPISLDSDHDLSPYSVNSPLRESKRPTRRKAEKKSRRKSKLVEEDDSEFISLLQKFNQNAEKSKLEKKLLAEQRYANLKAVEAREQRKLAILETAELREQMKHDSEIMALDTTNMSPQLQHYYQMLKNEIMAKVYTRLSSSQFYIPSSPDAQE